MVEIFKARELFGLESDRDNPRWSDAVAIIDRVIETLSDIPDNKGLDAQVFAVLGGSEEEFLEYARLRGENGDTGAARSMPKSLERLRQLKEGFPEIFSGNL